MTVAIANGFAISMDAEAARSWRAAHASDDTGVARQGPVPIEAGHLPLFLKQFPGAFKDNRKPKAN